MKNYIFVLTAVMIFSILFFSCNKDTTTPTNNNSNTGPVTSTFNSNPGLNKFITNAQPVFDTINANITDNINANNISDVKITLSDVSSVEVNKIKFSLIHSGIEVAVIDSLTKSGVGNFTNTVLWDSSGTLIDQGTTPYTGTFKPQHPLKGFVNADPAGQWIIKIIYSGALKTGVIKSWGITITYQAQPVSAWQLVSTMTNAGIHALYFLDANNGWLYGKVANIGSLYRTTNGGISWLEILRDTVAQNSFNSMFFFNTTNGFACGGNGEIWNTNDGGHNWYGQGIAGNVSLKGIQFLNSSTGLVCGGNPAVIYKTTDGGLFWSGGTISTYSYLECICFADANTAYAAGDYDVVKSVDGGNTWSILITYGSIYRGEFPNIQFFNANTGYVAAGRDGILYTSNGGSNWSSRNPYPGFGTRGLSCSDINTCYIAGADSLPSVGGKIYKSTNSGLNWSLQLTVPYIFFGWLQFFDANTGFAGGVDNPQNQTKVVLYKTTTGGQK